MPIFKINITILKCCVVLGCIKVPHRSHLGVSLLLAFLLQIVSPRLLLCLGAYT